MTFSPNGNGTFDVRIGGQHFGRFSVRTPDGYNLSRVFTEHNGISRD